MSLGIPTLTSIYYALSGNPIMHQIAFGTMVCACVLEGLRRMLLMRGGREGRGLVHNTLPHTVLSLSTLVSGFVLWNIDNYYCSNLRQIRRHHLDPFLGFLTQFHAWWHLLTLIASIYAVKSIEEHCENSDLVDTNGMDNEGTDESAALFSKEKK